MRANVGSRVDAMRDQVERFAERWSQLKPKDDVMEADSSVCAAALATVKDRKAELQQLMTEWEKLRSVGVEGHFGVWEVTAVVMVAWGCWKKTSSGLIHTYCN